MITDKTVKIEMPQHSTTGKITYDDGELSRAAALKLLSAFDWSKSEEGKEFWNSVYYRISQIATRGY